MLRGAVTAWIFIYSWIHGEHRFCTTFEVSRMCKCMYPMSNCARLATNNFLLVVLCVPTKTSTASFESNHKFMYIKLITMRTCHGRKNFRWTRKMPLTIFSAVFVKPQICSNIFSPAAGECLCCRKLFDFCAREFCIFSISTRRSKKNHETKFKQAQHQEGNIIYGLWFMCELFSLSLVCAFFSP